jgi:hypothetical protein
MKNYSKCVRNITAMWFLAFVAGLSATATPVAQVTTEQPIPRSIFNLPANPQEGRDPFFPNSLRPYVTAAANAPVRQTRDLSALVLQGISGPPDQRLVIINGVTFAVGDEAEVRTPQGRIHIRCLEIKDKSALIEADGQRHELYYGEKQ